MTNNSLLLEGMRFHAQSGPTQVSKGKSFDMSPFTYILNSGQSADAME